MAILRASEYQIFWSQLFALLACEQPLKESLREIILNNSNDQDDKFRRGLEEISAKVDNDVAFAQALSESGMFSRAEVSLIEAGELCNNLKSVIAYIVDGTISTRADQYETFYRVFGTLIGGGVPVLSAIKISGEKADEPLSKAIEKILASVKEGDTVAAAMSASGEFSKVEINFIAKAEAEGYLDKALLILAGIIRCRSEL